MCATYHVEGLRDPDAEKLFYQHLGECPPEMLEQVPKILRICGGLPLALELVGEHLGKDAVKEDRRSWVAIIDGLEKCRFDSGIAKDPLNAVVRWSFDQLDAGTKRVFVDICSLFRNQGWMWAELIGKGTELSRLTEYALVKKFVKSLDSGTPIRAPIIQIHDLLAALGISESDSTRVSIHDREAFQTFMKADLQARHKVEGFFAPRQKYGYSNAQFLELRAEELDAMHECLRILIIGVDGDLKPEIFASPSDGCIPKVSGTCKMIPPHLQICSIEGKYTFGLGDKTVANYGTNWGTDSRINPGELGNASGGESSIQSVFPYAEISSMEQLRVLCIRSCSLGGLNLEEAQLPENVEILKLENVPGFQKFKSDGFEKCMALHTLRLQGCFDLISLPYSLGILKELQILVLGKNGKLKTLPNFSNLPRLKKFRVYECPLKTLRSGLGSLPHLKILELQKCEELTVLPELPKSLERFEVHECPILTTLPSGLGCLPHLEILELQKCWLLEMLPELPKSLERFEVQECPLTSLPSGFGNLSRLRILDLDRCWRLKMLPDDFGNLKSLEELTVVGSPVILPGGCDNLSRLRHLVLFNCQPLEELPELPKSLEQLTVIYCPLTTLPSGLGNLSHLEHLMFHGCEQLEKLPDDLGNLTELQRLIFFECGSLKILPSSIVGLKRLKSLSIIACPGLDRSVVEDTLDTLRSAGVCVIASTP